ncbi:dipeptide ABC transporter ATP-binding protein [Ornithinimicrobium cavernae]|uniref:dipeptide ABC transporter ATP-binding protein n=1 Tax=Ornithinimicrobium cavernae TaxID=2666047 RepID=UPI000D699F73|nr:ABC transporter ATP-binding protein [Ornithinimicrobium cavernae]
MADPTAAATPVLEVSGLTVAYGDTEVLRDVSFTLAPGERLGIVGESGSGKSTAVSAVLGLLAGDGHVTGGSIRFRGEEIAGVPEARMRQLRGRSIALIPQDPMTNLNPSMRVGDQIADALRAYGTRGRAAVRAHVVRLMTEAGIPEAERRRRQFPHEFSGGMRQRVLIAMALAGDPDLIIADEPTSALDVTVQKQILDHLQKLVDDRGMSLLFVTHDLGVAADRTDQIVVMHRGAVAEQGGPAQVLFDPQDDYTRELIAASPKLVVPPRDGADDTGDPVLEVRDLTRVYPLRGRREELRALDGVTFTAARGRTTAIIGESGSGKSTTARIVLGLETATSGEVVVDGTSTTSSTRADLARLRRFAQPVFQDPYSSLNPTMSVERIILEPLTIFRVGTKTQRRARVAELLDQVALPRSVADARPGELSGGQRQRVAIARAIASRPELLVCDEAVSALDVLVQDQILTLLRSLQEELGLSCLFISHDLAVVADFAHDVVVMRSGRIVEQGPVDRVIDHAEHEYTQALIAAVPGDQLTRV